MSLSTIVDAGPLAAFFMKSDTYHNWASDQFTRLESPLLTCESVLSETCFLLARGGLDPSVAIDFTTRGALRLDFSLGPHVEPVCRLMRRYKDVGISLADACLVRMSEMHPSCQVMTLDRDFLIYRRDGRRTIPLLAPFD